MKILVACEESQEVTKAFRNKGHEAYSCDIQPCSGGLPEYHFQQDIFEVIEMGWDMMIAHPPCTFLSNAGNRHFNINKYGSKAIKRMIDREFAAIFFLKLFDAPINKICIENPVGFINHFLPPNQTIHPCFFGDADYKKTCLWLKGLNPLLHVKESDLFNAQTHVKVKPVYIDNSGKPRYFTESIRGTNEEIKLLRSKTFPGIAKAMADQWG